MSLNRWGPVALAALWLWPGWAHGQSAEFRDAYAKSRELFAVGSYREALPFAETALKLGEREFGADDAATATLFNNLASIHRAQGQFGKARPLHERALEMRENILGPDHRDVAYSLADLAELNHAQGRYAEAEPLFRRALAIFEATLGPGHPQVGSALDGLA